MKETTDTKKLMEAVEATEKTVEAEFRFSFNSFTGDSFRCD